MKKLKIIALATLLLGLAAGAMGAWLYFRAQSQASASRELESRSFDLEDESDKVKDTPQEGALLRESENFQTAAVEALDSAKRNQRLALTSGIAGIVLILISIATTIVNVKKSDAEQS